MWNLGTKQPVPPPFLSPHRLFRDPLVLHNCPSPSNLRRTACTPPPPSRSPSRSWPTCPPPPCLPARPPSPALTVPFLAHLSRTPLLSFSQLSVVTSSACHYRGRGGRGPRSHACVPNEVPWWPVRPPMHHAPVPGDPLRQSVTRPPPHTRTPPQAAEPPAACISH